jgi:hypothetical protein
MSVADVLAAARGGQAAAAAPAKPAPPPPAPEPDAPAPAAPAAAPAKSAGESPKIDRTSMSIDEKIAYCKKADAH